jgi:phosphoesterase RecJ-like protein
MDAQTLTDQSILAPPALLDTIVSALRAASRVQICGHVRPDGDCIGSMLAMHHLLDGWGIANAICAANIPITGYDDLTDFAAVRERLDPGFNPDLTVFLDCANLHRGPADWTSPAPIVNIDHHASNPAYGKINWIESRCSSVGEMMFFLIGHAGVELSAAMATALLVAMTTDTGSFRFSNTGPLQHRIAAQLIEAGALPTEIARMAYGSLSLNGAHIAGCLLSNIHLECDGRLGWSEIDAATYAAAGGEAYAPENLCDHVRNLRGVRVAVLLHEKPGGGLRANFRSDGSVDVGAFAAIWGGGGHAASAGLTIETGDFPALRDEILARVRALFA